MNAKSLYALWAVLFSLCAGLGFIPEPEEPFRIFLTILSVLFFLPPALLLHESRKNHNREISLLIRNLSLLSLGLTLVLLILNFLTVFRSEVLGQLLHDILTIVSSPMICSGHWALSLFLWACLLMASWKQLKR